MNWTELICRLIENGMTEKSIAEKIGGTSQPTIHRIKNGRIPDPKHSLGEKLINLDKELAA